MFGFLKKRRIEKITGEARIFLQSTYLPPVEKPQVKFSREVVPQDNTDQKFSTVCISSDDQELETGVMYSSRESTVQHSIHGIEDIVGDSIGHSRKQDKYDNARVAMLMQKAGNYSSQAISRALGEVLNQTFTDRLINIINQKGLRDAQVYKAAQMDRRLFSKIMSDREFRPSKDTALALIFALKLSLAEATDLLSRAGYTLSHSSKRDVILEYFINEGICNLTDINLVLDNLGQKIIGR